jgi:hypothetical protein
MARMFMKTLIAGGLALSAAGIALAPAPAEARVHVGIGIGIPLFGPGYYAAPAYYPYYPPYYYATPPVYYAPPPAAALAPPAMAAPSAANGACREYSSTQIIGGTPQQVLGTACQQPDGSWRIVN